MWTVRGRELSKTSAESAALPRIELQEFAELQGAPGILRSFFREFLDELEPEMRFEALEMLELLVTANRTRNIVERNDLIQPRFRKGAAGVFRQALRALSMFEGPKFADEMLVY